MQVTYCGEDEVRIPFVVNDDRSRTWVITLRDDHLLLKHDHRRVDGTPEDLTMYGGFATPNGTAKSQQFLADEYTRTIVPGGGTAIWTLEFIDDEQQFVYDVIVNEKPRFRAVFDLSKGLRIEDGRPQSSQR